MIINVNANVSSVYEDTKLLIASLPIGIDATDFWKGMIDVWIINNFMPKSDASLRIDGVIANMLAYKSESIADYLFTLEARILSGRTVRTESGFNDGVKFCAVSDYTQDPTQVALTVLHSQVKALMVLASNRAHSAIRAIVGAALHNNLTVVEVEVEKVIYGLFVGRLKCTTQPPPSHTGIPTQPAL